MAAAKQMTFVKRCEQEGVATPQLAEEVDKILAESGCTVPGTARPTARKELAAALVWLRAHRADKEEDFDALPAQNQAALKKLFTVVDVPGKHWARTMTRMLAVFEEAASPPKRARPQAPAADGCIRPEDQRRPPDAAEGAMAEQAPAQPKRARTAAELAYDAIEEDEAVRMEAAKTRRLRGVAGLAAPGGRMVSGPVIDLAATGALGGFGFGPPAGNILWLPRERLVADVPESVLRMLFLGGDWTRTEASRAVKDEALTNTMFENNVAPQWAHRISFELLSPHNAPNLGVMGENLALCVRICLDEPLGVESRMITMAMLAQWVEVQDLLTGPQVAESSLKPMFDIINGLFDKRRRMLTALVQGRGDGGLEVSRAVQRQQHQVEAIWTWVSTALSENTLTSPTKTSANAMWLTLIGPVMDLCTRAKAAGKTSTTAAQARIDARRALLGIDQPAVPARRKLAQTPVQPALQIAAPVATMPVQQMGWMPTPNWGPPPPPGWMNQMHQAPPAYPTQQPLPALPPPPPPQPRQAPAPAAPPPAPATAKPAGGRDGWTGQPTTSSMLGNRAACEVEALPTKYHCVMCLRANPGARAHAAWECAIKLARRADGEPCPGFDVNGERNPAAWTADGNLQQATVAAWRGYIEKHGLEQAKSAPGPARLS